MTTTARMRLWFTADRDALVPEGHQDAAFLYAAIGDEIPDDAADRFGLAEGLLPGHADEAVLEGERLLAEEARAKAAAHEQEQREAAAESRAEAEKAEADPAEKAEAEIEEGDAAMAEAEKAEAAAKADPAATAKPERKPRQKAKG